MLQGLALGCMRPASSFIACTRLTAMLTRRGQLGTNQRIKKMRMLSGASTSAPRNYADLIAARRAADASKARSEADAQTAAAALLGLTQSPQSSRGSSPSTLCEDTTIMQGILEGPEIDAEIRAQQRRWDDLVPRTGRLLDGPRKTIGKPGQVAKPLLSRK